MAELTATKVKRTKRPGKYPDGGNLYLQVAANTRVDGTVSITKSWAFRYRRFGKDTWLGLGPYPDVGLAEARDLAAEERRKKRAGIDPLNDKIARQVATRAASDDVPTFADCATRYIDANAPGWSNPKHVSQWRNTMTDIAGPVIGHLPVTAINTGLVLRVIEPLWRDRTETATRVRQRIEAILDWATVRGFRDGDNPARWSGHLDKVLPQRSKVATVRHHPALPYADVGAFMVALRDLDGVAARALEFTILTAARTNEVVKAEWSEFDLDAGLWIIPGERMKAGREHRVPLSPSALKIVKEQRGKDDRYVFPGHKRDSHLSNGAMAAVIKNRMERSGITVHGFRSTFRDWCGEETNTPRDVAEMALAHSIGDKTEAAYRRGDLFKKRETLMNAWARYCNKKPGKATVTELRSARG
jgi:integrase